MTRDDVAQALDLVVDPGEIRIDAAGVDDEQEVLRGEAVDEQIVDEGAARRQQAGILRLSDLEGGGVVGREALHGG